MDPGHLTRLLRCPHCGREFVPAGGAPSGGGPHRAEPSGGRDRDRDRDRRRPPPRRSSSAPMVIGLLFVLLVLGAVGAFGVMAMKQGPEDEESRPKGKTVAVAPIEQKPLAPPPEMLAKEIQLSSPPSGKYYVNGNVQDMIMDVIVWEDPHLLSRGKKVSKIEHDKEVQAVGVGTNRNGIPVWKIKGTDKFNRQIEGFVSAFYVEVNDGRKGTMASKDERHMDHNELERRKGG
ncbi:MAG: hypothetical protein L0216_11620 [Planctomycetales bacterium]|nr:hypothetical protein [Planctomycetales bacterium]